jgi:glycosyltransferase involved in cell wall biosynthesis
MAKAPTVSVIIPTRDRGDLLQETLESVALQTFDDHEIVLVDDGSSEPVVVPDFGRPVTIARHVRPLGPGSARNTGLAHANGEYVLFLDDDDLITPRRLERGVETIGRNPMHAMGVAMMASDRTLAIRRDLRFDGDLTETLHRGVLPSTGQTLFRRDCCVQFDPSLRLMEDVEWWVRMRDQAVFSWSDDVGLIIRVHDGVRPDIAGLTRHRAREMVIARHKSELAGDPASLAYHLRRAGSAAYLANRRFTAAKHAARSVMVRPSRSAFGLLGRSLLWPSGSRGRIDV